MPFDHDQVVTAQFQQLAAARAKALGDYEASRLNDDSAGTMEAADRIVDADARLQSLNRIAQNLVADQQHQASRPVSKYGLSEEEKSVAHAALIDRKDLPPLSSKSARGNMPAIKTDSRRCGPTAAIAIR